MSEYARPAAALPRRSVPARRRGRRARRRRDRRAPGRRRDGRRVAGPDGRRPAGRPARRPDRRARGDEPRDDRAGGRRPSGIAATWRRPVSGPMATVGDGRRRRVGRPAAVAARDRHGDEPDRRRRRPRSTGRSLGVTTWEAGRTHGAQLLPAIGRLHRRGEPAPLADPRRDRRDGARRVHRPAGRARDRQGARPRARRADRRRLDRRGPAAAATRHRRGPPSGSCSCCRPDRTTAHVVRHGGAAGAPARRRRAGARAGRGPRRGRSRRTARRPTPSPAARRPEPGFPAALVRLGAGSPGRRRRDDLARLVPEYVSLPRGVARESGEVAWSRDPR